MKSAAGILATAAVLVALSPPAARADDPYIQSDGTAGISTGYRMKGGISRVEVDFALTTTDASAQWRIFGGTDTGVETQLRTALYLGGSAAGGAAGTGFQFVYGDNNNALATGVDCDRHTAVIDLHNKTNVFAGAETKGLGFDDDTTGIVASVPLSIFGQFANTNATRFANGTGDWNARCANARIYGVKIYENYDLEAVDNSGHLVHDFVPCLRDDGVACFKDLVTGGFIVGENPGAFTASEDAPEYPDNSYVSTAANATGAKLSIDTGYVVTENTRVELDCALAADMTASDVPVNTLWYLFDGTGSASPRFEFNFGKTGSANGSLRWSAGGHELTIPSGWWRTAFDSPESGNDFRALRRTYTLDGFETKVSVSTCGFKNSETNYENAAGFSGYTAGTLKLASFVSGSPYNAPLKIYGCKIYESGELVHDFVPALDKFGTVGMRDVKTGDFVTGKDASGGGATLVPGGAPLEYDSEYDPYIESDGTCGISTGYRMKGGVSRVEVDFRLTDPEHSAQMRVFGTAVNSLEPSLGTMLYMTGSGGGGPESFLVRNIVGETVVTNNMGWVPAQGYGVRYTVVDDLKNGFAEILSPGYSQSSPFESSLSSYDGVTADLPLSLFGAFSATTATKFINGNGEWDARVAKAKVYGVKIYENYDLEAVDNSANLVHNFVPCLRDGVACFRDTVTGMFIMGENVDAFSIGGDYGAETDDSYVSTVSGTGAKMSIDTGVKVTDATRIELDCAIAENMVGDVEWHIFDCNNDPRFLMCYAGGKLRYVAKGVAVNNAVELDSTAFPSPTTTGRDVRRVLVLDNAGSETAVVTFGYTNKCVEISGTTATTKSSNLILGAYFGGKHFNTPLKIYGCKIYENGELAHDFVPALNNRGETGLRDTVTGKFVKGRDGSGGGNTLTSGGVPLAYDRKCDPYIESLGIGGMSTGYRMNEHSRVEVDYALTTTAPNGMRLFGSISTENTLRTLFYWNVSVSTSNEIFQIDIPTAGGSKRFGRVFDSADAIYFDTDRHTVAADMKNAKCHISTADDVCTKDFDNAGTYESYIDGKVADLPLSLFGEYGNTNATTFVDAGTTRIAKARIYGMKIYEDYDESSDDNSGKLVRDFRPCVKGGIPGFLDSITGLFITGENPSGFVAGGDDLPEYTDGSYVSTAANASGDGVCIDTGVELTANSRVELDCALAADYPAEGGSVWTLFSAGGDQTRMGFNDANGLVWSAGASSAWQTDLSDAVAKAVATNNGGVRRTFSVDVANGVALVETYGFTNKTAAFSAAAAAGGTLKISANGAGNGDFAPLKIYGLKIYESGTLAHDFTPALNISGKIGLRDVVTGAFASGVNAEGGEATLSYGGVALEYDSEYDPYIECNGTSGISTGYRMKGGVSRVEVDFRLTAVEGSAQWRIFGDTRNTSDLNTMFYVTSNDRFWFCNRTATSNYDDYDNSWTGVDAVRHTAITDLKNNKNILTGFSPEVQTIAYSFAGATAQLPLSLFANYVNTNATAFGNSGRVRIYGVKIYENYDEDGENEPVLDLVPCLRDGVACFRDTVTGMFIMGENVDAFSIGGDYETAEDYGYVSTVSENATAKLYIDTGYSVTDQTRVELDCAIATNAFAESAPMWYLFDATPGYPRFHMGYSAPLRYWAGDGSSVASVNFDTSAFPKPTTAKDVRRTFILDNHEAEGKGSSSVVTHGFENKKMIFDMTSSMPGGSKLVLGAYYTGSSYHAPLKIYGCKIYEGGTLAMDFVPCVKNGIAGLRDSLTGKFISGSDYSNNGNLLSYGGNIDVIEDPYIEMVGTSGSGRGISTGYRMKGGISRVEVDFQLTAKENSGQMRIFGDTTKETTLGTMFYFTGTGSGVGAAFQFRNRVKGSFSSTTYDKGLAASADLLRHTLVTDLANGKNQIVTTNVVWSGNFAASAFTGLLADLPLSLFANYCNTNATAFDNSATAKIFGVKFYENYDESAADNSSKLVHNFVPCYKVGADGKDKVPCFRDLVTGRFIIGEDVSAFAGGGDIPEIADDPYVSTVSDTPGEFYYVDTGYQVKDTTRVELDCALASNMVGTARWNLFDARNSAGNARFCMAYNTTLQFMGKNTALTAIDASAFPKPTTGKDVRRTFILDIPGRKTSVVTSTFTNKTVDVSGSNSYGGGETLKLGGVYSGGGEIVNCGLAPLKIYGCKIYESGVLVTNFTPYVLRGIAGLRDAETGGFVSGRLKTGSAAGVEAGLPHGGDWEPYILSFGTSAMSTGYRMNANSRVEVDFKLESADATGGNWIYGTSSSQESSLRSGLYITGAENATGEAYKFSTGTSSSGAAGDYSQGVLDTARHIAVTDIRGKVLVMETDGIQDYSKSIASVNFSGAVADLPLSLFAQWSNAGATAAGNCARVRIYGVKIYENGMVVRNYVPCYRDDDVACFRDMVDGGYITGEDVAAFETGGDAPVYESEMHVSTVSGAGSKMYLDTGYKVKDDTRIELDCAVATNMVGSATWSLFGGDGGCDIGYKCTASGLDWSAGGNNAQTGFQTSFGKPEAAAKVRRTYVIDNDGLNVGVVTRGFTNCTATFTATTPSAATGRTLKIGASAAASANHAPLDIYGLKIYESGSLVRHFVPYRENGAPGGDGDDAAIGMRDVVTGAVAYGLDWSGGGNVLDAGGDWTPCIEASGRNHSGYALDYRMKGGVSKIEVDFRLLDAIPQGRVFGNDAGDGSRYRDKALRTVLYVSADKKNFTFYVGKGVKVSQSDANNRVARTPLDALRHVAVIDLENGVNVLMTGGDTNFVADIGLDLAGITAETPMPIFNRFFNDECSDFSNWASMARVYSVKFYEHGELVREYVPYVNGKESGFRDRETGEFAAGYGEYWDADAAARHVYKGYTYADDAYIASDGTKGFVTGYRMKGACSRVEVDFALSVASAQKWIFGDHTGESTLQTFLYTTGSGTGDSFRFCTRPYTSSNCDKQWMATPDTARHTVVTDLKNRKYIFKTPPVKPDASYDSGASNGRDVEKSFESDFAGKTATLPLSVFGEYTDSQGNAFQSCPSGRIYSVRIYEDYVEGAENTPVHEFIPYKKGSIVGFCDTVTGEIKELDSGHFTYGGLGQDRGQFKSYVSPVHAAALAPVGPRSHAPITAYAPGAEAYRWYDANGIVDGETSDSLTVSYTSGGASDDYWSVGYFGEDFGCGVKSAPEAVKSARRGFIQMFK